MSVAVDASNRVFAMRPPRLLATLQTCGVLTLASTPGGYVLAGEGDRQRYVLAVPNPRTPSCVLHLPLGPLREFFHRPDKLAAALRGDLSADDPFADLSAAGWTFDTSWNGDRVVLPDARSSDVPYPVEGLPARAASPFILGVAVERATDLAGRERSLDAVLEFIERRQPTRLLGPRRSGKTSLLRVLAARLRDDGRSVVATSLEGVRLASRDELAAQLDPSLRGVPAAADAFEARAAEQPDRVFLVDELAGLAMLPPLELGWFRKMSQEAGSFVLAGTPWDWRRVFDRSAQGGHGSPLNNFRGCDLGPLDERASVAFLTERALADHPVTEAAARWAYEATDGWPYYLQLLGWELLQRSRGGNREAHNLRDAMLHLVKELLPVAAQDAFESRWAELPPPVRVALVHRTEISRLSRDTRQLLVRTGLFTEGVGLLRDAPFFDWIHRSADSLPLAPEEPS